MPSPANAMEIFKLLPKTNCRKCNLPTCLAFAAAVFQGRKPLDLCPYVPPEVVTALGAPAPAPPTAEQDMEASLAQLKHRITTIDLAAAARRLDARFDNGKLSLKVCGKTFSVDTGGNLFADIHVHAWIAGPVLNYILDGRGVPVSGNWVPLRELKRGGDWYRLFGQRCEKPLKRIADTYTDLFEDLIHLFDGKPVCSPDAADIALVLYPLPKVPLMISYWKPEDGLESSLHLFFDATAADNLNIESLYALGAGLVVMFEKIALRHGVVV